MTVFCNVFKALFYRLPSCTELSWHTAAAHVPENSLHYVQPNLIKRKIKMGKESVGGQNGRKSLICDFCQLKLTLTLEVVLADR